MGMIKQRKTTSLMQTSKLSMMRRTKKINSNLLIFGTTMQLGWFPRVK
jgi:hypothetical protein